MSIRAILLSILLFTPLLMGATTTSTGEQMDASLLTDPNSNFRVEVERSGTYVQAFVNGVTVFESYNMRRSTMQVPVNSSLTSGDNEFVLKVWAAESTDFKMLPEARATARLYVYDRDGKEHLVSQLAYSEKAGDKFIESSKAGMYTWDKGFKEVTAGGELILSPIDVNYPQALNGNKVNGTELVQIITMPTKLPRWKFLDSEDILDKDYDLLSDEEYEALKETQLIKDLYAQYDRIHEGLSNNKVDSIIDMFDERSAEFDIAFNRPIGSFKKGLAEKFKGESLKGGELEAFNHSDSYFYIDRNNKLAYVESAISFKRPDSIGGGYSTYGMTFRLENGKWILTR
jgi:hypothetical protein